MGKHRKQKKRTPLLARPGSAAGDELLKNDKILPIIAKLKSSDFRDRVVAMSAVNSMIDDSKLRELLLKEKLLQVILSHSLSDMSQEIVAEGFGLLRNIIIEEGRDPAVYLFRQNILLTIKNTAERLQKVWVQNESLSKLTGQDKVIVREFIENLIGLTCGLALADDEIYDNIVSSTLEPLAPFLLQLLDSEFSLIKDAVLELLYVQSEDAAASAIIVNGGLSAKVNSLDVTNSVTAQVYKLGITYNLIEISHNGSENDLLQLLQALYQVIEPFDLSTTVPAPPSITEPKKLKAAVTEAARIRSQINATQVAFEIIASIMESSAHLSNPSPQYIEFIGEKITPLCIKALQYPNYTLRASSTLNNIGWTFNLLEIDWTPLAEQIWTATLPLLQEPSGDINLFASAIGLLGSTAQVFRGHVPLQPNDLGQLLEKCMAFRPAELNLAFEDTKDFMHLLQALMPFLCLVGTTDESSCVLAADTVLGVLEVPSCASPELLSECINGIFELFGDNDAPNNKVYIDKQFNPKLKQLKPELKRALRNIDKQNIALKEQVDETLFNLDRFIDYKEASLPQ